MSDRPNHRRDPKGRPKRRTKRKAQRAVAAERRNTERREQPQERSNQ